MSADATPALGRFSMAITGYILARDGWPISQAGWYDMTFAADGAGEKWSIPTFAIDDESIHPAPPQTPSDSDWSEIAGHLSSTVGAERAAELVAQMRHAVTTTTIPWQIAHGEHPGVTLAGRLKQLGMSQVEFCRRSGVSTKHLNQIIKGQIGVSADIALLLERDLGVPAMVWNRLDAAWRDKQARARWQIGRGEGE